MSGFPLLDPPHHLVERIISKVETKANYRLRQTCHAVNDLIQTSPNIIVHLDGEFRIFINGASTFELLLHQRTTVDFVAFYGARLGILSLYDSHGKYDRFYELLKKYRITCDDIYLPKIYSTEQCAALIKLLKPIGVRVTAKDNEGMLEMVYNFKNLKRVDVAVEPDDMIPAMERLIAKCEDVKVSVDQVSKNRFDVLREVLQVMLSQPLVHVKKFFFMLAVPEDTDRQELEQEFPMDWTRILTEKFGYSDDEIFADYPLPPHFPQKASCRLRVLISSGPKVFYSIKYEVKNISV